MEKIYKDCKPTICDRSVLMTNDWEFMTKEEIKEKCECVSKSVCLQIADLLKNWHRPEAQELMK